MNAMENPFSTRRVRPGALAYQFRPGSSAARLLDRFESLGWQAEIVGPHGSGKSTLLETLLKSLELLGRGSMSVERLVLRRGMRKLPQALKARLNGLGRQRALSAVWQHQDWPAWGQPRQPGVLLAIDGFEQLGRFRRRRTVAWTRRLGVGLLVTCHQPTGILPPLTTLRPELETLWDLVCRLQAGTTARIDQGDATGSFVRQGGNFREILFDLYLLHERRRIPSRMD